MKDFLAPTPSVCQPLFETSDVQTFARSNIQAAIDRWIFTILRPVQLKKKSTGWRTEEGSDAPKFDFKSSCASNLQSQPIRITAISVDLIQRTAKGAGGKGATSKIVKKCQKYFRHFSTLFDSFRAGQTRQNSSKSVKIFFDNFRAAPVFRPLLWGSDLSGTESAILN